MPEQNPQNVTTFNPADFSLPASISTNEAPTLIYRVIANSDQPAMSSYVQTVFHRSSGTTSPGATLTDQALPAVRRPEDMQPFSDGSAYSQNDTATQTFAPPIINVQQQRAQNVQPYRLTDQVPAVGDAIYYPPAQTQSNESFAPPANRSALPYVPKENSRPSESSEAIESVLDVSKHTAKKIDSEKSNPIHSQALVEKTKLVDLHPRSQQSTDLTIAKQPARDANTTTDQAVSPATPTESVELYSETGFLKRQAFSSKFTVTQDQAEEKQPTKKIIYLKSAPAQERSAKLEVPQFQRRETLTADIVEPKTETPFIAQPTPPKLVPDYAMLPPIPTQTPPTPTAESTSTISEATTFVPEPSPFESPKESITEPVTTSTNPFEAVEEPAEEIVEQSADTNPTPVDEESQAAAESESTFQMVESKAIETENSQAQNATEPREDELQSIQKPVATVEYKKPSSPASGFDDADFIKLEKAEIVEAPPAPSTNTRESSFQVVGYRQAKADTKINFHNAQTKLGNENVAKQPTQIILPKFQFNQPTSPQKSQTQLIAMTVQNTKQESLTNHQFEMPWLSPWWMLIGLIPIALYLGTTKLFQDDDEDFAYYNEDDGSSKSIDFGSDYGKIGGSKSDALYGNDDSLTKIQSTIRQANRQQLDSKRVKPAAAPSRSTVAFAESLIFELPSTEACANPSLAQEISRDQSPNFEDAFEIEVEPKKSKKTNNKKSAKKQKKRKR